MHDPYLKVGKIEFYPVHPIYKTTYVTVGKPHCCPVCHGSGIVDKGFFNRTGDSWVNSGGTEKCKACDGKMIVWG